MEKKLNTFMLSVFVIIFLFFILLPLFLCLGKIEENRKQHSRSVEKNKINSEIDVDADRNECLLGESEDLGQEYIDKLTFLGESTTYGLWRYGVLSDGKNTKQVWTGATYIDGVLKCSGTLSLSPSIAQSMIYYPENESAMTVSQAINVASPQYLVITLGLNNGASYYTEDQFKQCYRILLNSIIGASSDVNIILQSIFPVAKTCKISAYTPERIATCNSWVYDLALEYGVNYLDTSSILSDEDGFLLPEYDNGGDGIHLNECGLKAVLQYIKTHGHPKEWKK